ncbi:peptidase [Rhizobium laguerreae]|nr:prepilin peptidase [Rhizobium laguerreae]MBN9981216.1 prepilin peptidase [Rhizobium laguerreae]MBY3085403.1 peptidase [Rhizobium laguerreae]MBY3096305.1 peptidase [Rhizobium laguerreae]MBY3105560.1 peptidase [Rhizobium laguerreae]MBY3125167.1 peptidase [Rhizobium laguerreae]
MIVAAILLVFPLCLAFAAISDLLTMTIPNRVSLIMVISFAVLAPLSGVALPAIGMHALGAVIVFGICFALFALNVMGGGDAKLLSAATLWFGCEPALVSFLAYVSVIGGLVTLAILLIRSQSNTILAIGIPIPNSLLLAKKVPYGIAIAIGGFVAFPSSPLFLAALESLK